MRPIRPGSPAFERYRMRRATPAPPAGQPEIAAATSNASPSGPMISTRGTRPPGPRLGLGAIATGDGPRVVRDGLALTAAFPVRTRGTRWEQALPGLVDAWRNLDLMRVVATGRPAPGGDRDRRFTTGEFTGYDWRPGGPGGPGGPDAPVIRKMWSGRATTGPSFSGRPRTATPD